MNHLHFICFLMIFMILQYVLLISEWNYYLNMVSDIQGYKFNFYMNSKNEFMLKNIIIYSFLYILVTYFIYFYIIQPNKSYLEGFIFISILFGICDIGVLFSLFEKATYHLPILLYDTFIVGGLCTILSQYIFYNYYNILKKYISLLLIIYILLMLRFFYECYKYNPNINIKSIVLF